MYVNGWRYKMARTGRPKVENPKRHLIGLKLTDSEFEQVKEYASRHNMTTTQVLQRGLDMHYAKEKS